MKDLIIVLNSLPAIVLVFFDKYYIPPIYLHLMFAIL